MAAYVMSTEMSSHLTKQTVQLRAQGKLSDYDDMTGGSMQYAGH